MIVCSTAFMRVVCEGYRFMYEDILNSMDSSLRWNDVLNYSSLRWNDIQHGLTGVTKESQ